MTTSLKQTILCRVGVLILGALCAIRPAAAQKSAQADPPLPRDLDQRIENALAYLARQQKPDGSFHEGDDSPRAVALTGLSVLAFLSCGHMPDQGKYGLVVRGAVDYLLKQTPPDDSYFGRNQGSQLYGHAIATMALAEVYGNESDLNQRRQVRAALQRAVEVLLAAQKAPKKEPIDKGGWHYEPDSNSADLSVTAWCLLALRSAHNAGMDVPRQAITDAQAYVLRCYRDDQKGFAYKPRNNATASMTAAAVLALCLTDAAERDEVKQASQFLLDHLVDEKTPYFHYAHYYATQAAHQLGGSAWAKIWPHTYDSLSRRQLKDGSFRPAPGEPGKQIDGNRAQAVYATSMSVLALSVPYRLLPIYQR